MFWCGLAAAQAHPTENLWNRLSLDLGYELSYLRADRAVNYYSPNSTPEREVTAFFYVRYKGMSQGLSLNATFAALPWLGVGPEVRVQRDFDSPSHPWFEELGIHYGQRKTVSLGLLVEFRPWHRTFESRKGVFFRFGLRRLWSDWVLTRQPGVTAPTNGHLSDYQQWFAAGYRYGLGRKMSLHLMACASAGIGTLEGGLRLGGGFQ
jgi:hypothetical protein